MVTLGAAIREEADLCSWSVNKPIRKSSEWQKLAFVPPKTSFLTVTQEEKEPPVSAGRTAGRPPAGPSDAVLLRRPAKF